jgi:hypothetical protein
MIKKSIDHLKNNNMTYITHFIFACGHGIRCIQAGVFLVIHSLVPGLFPKTGSTLVQELNKSFTDHTNETT